VGLEKFDSGYEIAANRAGKLCEEESCKEVGAKPSGVENRGNIVMTLRKEPMDVEGLEKRRGGKRLETGTQDQKDQGEKVTGE